MMPLYLLDYHKQNLEFFLINFQLVPHNSFISSMLNQIFFQLLCKIFLCNLPLFLKFYFKILHIVFCLHQGIILQHLFIILEPFLDTNWVHILPIFLCNFQLCLQVMQISLIFLFLHQLFSFYLYYISFKLFKLQQRCIFQIHQF